MSDNTISIVPKQSNYPYNKAKAKEILDWLISKDIVKPDISKCVLGCDGYAISEGSKQITNEPEYLPFDLITCGLEISLERTVFDTGENGIDQLICPNCKQDISSEEWSLNDWYEGKNNDMECPLCKTSSEVHEYQIEPEFGFSDLGFTFWNWPEFTEDFIEEFKQKMGCDISIVFCHL